MPNVARDNDSSIRKELKSNNVDETNRTKQRRKRNLSFEPNSNVINIPNHDGKLENFNKHSKNLISILLHSYI